ncbi:AAA family ATPase [Helicobacter macacae]|uniref:Protein CR006 P-loop domain-containing protein n=1 Tax=Helicobacter macacae MIT 99-5501 TaxID=1357400 RepID=V8CCD6_9HELI|nr:AAA family ATPase [Helicobacter macacae]ETD25004.1 hypothetical protein HMPREF2086_00339 [Helicobacter macacae MIT 99-5501]
MITKIALQNVASYKEIAVLETNKSINLIYGLNGAGKTQIANFLQNQMEEQKKQGFEDCALEGLNNEKILVYNQNFVEANFYAKDKQKGIFTLAKENVEAEKELEQKQKIYENLTKQLQAKNDEIEKYNNDLLTDKSKIIDKVWEIKTKYQSDFEQFFKGHIGSKEVFADYFMDTIFSNNDYKQESSVAIDELKDTYKKLSDKKVSKFEHIPLVNIDEILAVERENIFGEAIVGNDDSVLASLINQLGNADWVKQGERYIEHSNNKCPFCQNDITDDFKGYLKEFFNDEYEKNIDRLKELQGKYNELLGKIPSMDTFFRGDILEANNSEFKLLYENLIQNIKNNVNVIADKIREPKEQKNLILSKEALDKLNQFLSNKQQEIEKVNKMIDDRKNEIKNMEKPFWQNVCFEFKGYVESFYTNKEKIEKNKANLNKAKNEVQEKINKTNDNIVELQQKSVNIDRAIETINEYLRDLGIVDFYVKKDEQSDDCAIVRSEDDKPCFKTLSEGEKTLIAFLYFLQLCQGKESKNETDFKKIIVIDDPISSLSYNYVFDIAQLIKNIFFEKTKEYVEQIFILTHHLYFFHELIGYKESYKDKIRMFRIYKGENNQSCIETIGKESVVNEYEAYWQILRDYKKNGANKYIIPNVMRNILEYFLGFVRKSKIDIVKELAESQDSARYKAFYRYINRESHSFISNIIYEKDFDENIFFEAFEKVFELMGHKEHYDKMIIQQAGEQNATE